MANNRWLRIRAQSPAPERSEALVEGLVAFGVTAIEQQGNAVITYIADALDAEATAHAIEQTVRAFAGDDASVDWSWIDDEDWSREWRRGLGARRVGRSFVVTPTWIDPQALPHERVITIDPQMAFGTGEHATTRGMLRLMEDAVRPGDTVLDVGSGSAILSIAAVMLGAHLVDSVEMDPDATENALENIERNGADEQVRFACELVDEAWLAARPSQYDVIVANVLSGVLKPLLPSFRTSMKHDGRLLLSGILQTEADGMIDAARAAGFSVDAEDREEEWWSALLTVRS